MTKKDASQSRGENTTRTGGARDGREPTAVIRRRAARAAEWARANRQASRASRSAIPTFTPASSCNVGDEVVVDGAAAGPRTSYTFTNVRSDHTLAVAFNYAFVSTISATGNLGGTITPRGGVSVPCGQDQTFTIAPTPDCGMVERVKIDAPLP